IDAPQQMKSIPSHLRGRVGPHLLPLRETILFYAPPVALEPFSRDLLTQPFRRHLRHPMEGSSQSFTHGFQPIQLAHRSQYVGGVRSLVAACLQVTCSLEPLQHFVEQQFFSASL